MAFDTCLQDAKINQRCQQNEQLRQETLAKVLQWLNQFAAQYNIRYA